MSERSYKIVQAKVSEEAFNQLEQIRKRSGFKSVYDLMQSLVWSFLRYSSMKEENDAQGFPVELVRVFEEMKNVNVSPISPNKKKRYKVINASLTFDYSGEKMIEMFSFNSDGTIKSTKNVNDILFTMMRPMLPTLTKKIELISKEFGDSTFAVELERVADNLYKNRDSLQQELFNEFELLERAKDYELDKPVRHKTKDIESL